MAEPKPASDIAVQAPTRVPPAAWAVLALLFVSVLGLLLSIVWQPAPRGAEQPDVASAPAPSDSADAAAADTGIVANDTPPPSPADDQVPLPSVKDEVPRAKPVAPRPMDAARAQRATRPTTAQRAAPSTAAQPATAARPAAMVYIHVRTEAQRAWAQRLVQPLARRGVRVAAIRVVKAGPSNADLRYFRREESAEAARVARALREVGLPAPRLNRVAGFESRSTPGQYELWLPPGAEKRGR
jgi:hypothetical protein